MDSNLYVVEEILCNLNFPDLISASETCTTWLAASTKAFEATSRVAIPDPQPDESPNLANFLERFKRIKDFKFKLSGREATPNGLNCILADLPLETSTTLTHVTLDYEPTAQVLEAINSFLGQLTSRFPALKELQICPNADPPEDLVSPSLDFILDNLVSSDEHPNLTVLRVPIGPNWGSGIDWRFLTPLKKLETLHLLKFHIRGGGKYVQRQLEDFARHFPTEVNVSKLNIHLLGNYNHFLGGNDYKALNSAFKAINPETCTLYIEQVESDGDMPRNFHMQYRSVIEQMASSTLKRINVHYSMPLNLFKKNDASEFYAFRLIGPLKHFRTPHLNAHVLLRIDLWHEETGSSPSFIELECAQFKAPLILRHGPTGDLAKIFEQFLHFALQVWSTDDPAVPNYNVLRKFTFDENQEIVDQKQFERITADIVAPFPDRPDVLRVDGPAHRAWRETEFLSSPHSSDVVNAQPSWTPQTSSKTKVRALSATGISIYSID